MERKDYLKEELSTKEKNYIYTIILNERYSFLRDNYAELTTSYTDVYDCNIEGDNESSVLDAVISKCELEITSAIEFQNVIGDKRLYNIVKALSLKEKMVLFYLLKENKTAQQTANLMNINKATVYRIKDKVIDKILKSLLGGASNG